MSEKKEKIVGGSHCCSAINCSNRRLKCPELSFFSFPKDEKRCRIWLQNIRRQDLMNKDPSILHKQGYYLCSNHFEDSQFMNVKEKKRLIWCAVPTIFDIPNPPGSSGKRLYHRRQSLPTELVPGKSIVTPHCHSGKEPLDRKKQIETERNGGCQTARTESCPKSQKNRKRKLSNKVKLNRKGMELTNITCNDEHSDTEQKFIIKIEREDDYEETYVNSYLSSEAAASETVLEKQVKIEPDSISDDLFEMRSNSKESHGQSSHSADILKLEPDSAYAEWPELTGLPDTGAATEMEVKIEPCSDIEEKLPVFFVSSNMAQNTYLADSNMISEPVRTFVKSEIKSDPDDSEQTTTVYVCELCNECFYSHNQLLSHSENHTINQIYL